MTHTLIDDQINQHFALLPAMQGHAEMLHTLAADVWARLDGDGCLFAFGNGGSAAEAQHLVGELIGHYHRDRRPLRAQTLSTDPTVVTCIGNDYDFDDIFTRQVEALARPADVVFGFSTSGTSPNVVRALDRARALGAMTVLFTGESGGAVATGYDYVFAAPGSETPRIQEMHQLAMHVVCALIDEWV